jgi:drug/metabolite transporter (DMT)-like permease
MRGVATPGRRIQALGEGVLLVLTLGSTLDIAKGALGHLGPLTLAALRYCLAALVLIPLALRDDARYWTWPPRLWLQVLAIGLLGSPSLSALGRPLARERRLGVLSLTAAPLAIGGLLLLPIALATEGAPRLDLSGVAVVVWLAVVNTAFAYILYNHALQARAAFEVSALASLSPLVTAIGAWLFLAEPLIAPQIAGMIIMVSGVILIQSTGQP